MVDGTRRNAGVDHAGRDARRGPGNLDDVIDAVENDAGRPPTDEEFREAGIDPEDNRQSGSGELPDMLD